MTATQATAAGERSPVNPMYPARSLSHSAALIASGLLLSALASCSKSKPATDVPDAPARRALFEHLGEEVILAAYDDFLEHAQALRAKVEAHAEDPSADALEESRAAFRDAMLVWQRAELFQVGPAAHVSSAAPGSQGLRETIYIWPDQNLCAVGAALLEETYEDYDAFLESTFPNARGLSALELLLFDESDDPHCDRPTAVDPEAYKELAEGGELPARRAELARVLVRNLEEQAQRLRDAFESTFLPELKTAGSGSKLFRRTQDALNALSDALFYLDTETKDMKLADPAGVSLDCMQPCPDLVEHPFAKLSKEAVLENLDGARALFEGSPPDAAADGDLHGLYDLLRSVGAEELASDMEKLLGEAVEAVEAIDGTLEGAAAGDDEQVMQLRKAYAALQAFTDRLKTDFLRALSLSPPEKAAGDND